MLKITTNILLLLFLSSCLFSKKIHIKNVGNFRLYEQDFKVLKDWENDDHKLALQTFLHSCRKFSKLPQNKPLNGKFFDATAEDYRDVCDIAEVVKTMSKKQTKNFFENWFKLFLVENSYGDDDGLFTGYYEPTLYGSFVQTEKYKYPIYAKPKVETSYINLTRQDIESGALDGQKLELLYVDNKVDLFFLHIQGSGKVILPNGSEIKVAYAGKNQYPFTAISNEMLKRNLISKNEFNSKGVYKWLIENPEKSQEIMNINSSFTFFKLNDSDQVYGAQGVALTKERSLAVDNEIIPFGSLLWLETHLKDEKQTKFNKLMVAQDTGSAIKGAIRGDIYFGNGAEAEEKAFTMASNGKYYILLPINLVDKILGR
ncbi:MAG: murein transglycosylase A [Rickettsiales bacterium]